MALKFQEKITARPVIRRRLHEHITFHLHIVCNTKVVNEDTLLRVVCHGFVRSVWTQSSVMVYTFGT